MAKETRRHLSGIFLKLFLGLWSVFLVIGLAIWGVSTSYLQISDRSFERIDFHRPAQHMVNNAMGIAHMGGMGMLVEWLRNESLNNHPVVYVVDEHLRELSGRPIPAKAREQIEDPRILARTAFLAIGGTHYHFFAVRMDKPRNLLAVAFWRTPVWLHLLLAFLATVLVAGALAWNLARPIRKLDEAMRRAAEGNLEERISPVIGHKFDEIGDLARRYDAMAEKINGLLARQKRLFHDVSHELRSPLARIEVALALIEKNPQKSAMAIARIESEVEVLDALIEALLTYARLDENAPIVFESTDLVSVLEALVENANFEGSAKDVRVHLTTDATLPIKAHIESLSSGLENLIRNALRYSEPHTAVEVSAHREGDCIHIRIVDTGPGVDEAELAKLFEPFVRGGKEATGTGFGLGLAIAKRAIERHGGALQARNIQPHGLEMAIELPTT